MLRHVLREHAGALRADFQRVYGRDLMDLWRGKMGLIEAADLVCYLPAGSAVWRAEGGPMAWTEAEHFMSALEYNTHVTWWLKTKDGSKGKNVPEPLKPPRSQAEEAFAEARVMRQRAIKAQRALAREEQLRQADEGPETG